MESVGGSVEGRKGGKKRKAKAGSQAGPSTEREAAGKKRPAESSAAAEEALAAFWPGREKPKRKLHTFEKRRLRAEEADAARKAAKHDAQARREQRDKALREYQQRRRTNFKTLQTRTKKGQPKLAGQINLLVDKLERTLTKEKKRARR